MLTHLVRRPCKYKPKGGLKMKTRTLVSALILVLAILIVAGSCATGKKAYVAKIDEELYGIWVNLDYDEHQYPAKFIFKSDGTYEGYAKSDSTHYYYYGEYIITDKWIDTEGCIWYKYFYKTLIYYAGIEDKDPLYYLSKIDLSSNSLETVRSGIDYPIELSPDALLYTYNIYYRQ
jgi:hypothetical protein